MKKVVMLVTGGRHYSDRRRLFKELDEVHSRLIPDAELEVIHGDASGADELAAEWADSRGVRHSGHRYRVERSEWNRIGKAAGPLRNQRMLDENRIDMLIAFPGGTGTADMVARARRCNVPSIRVLT